MIAHDRVHAERRLEPCEHRSPFARRNEARDVAMTGDVIAEHDDEIGIQRIGAFDDRLDAIERHPGIASMEVGDGGDPELEIRRPLPRRKIIADGAEPQHRLDAEPIGRRRSTEGAKPADGPEELTSREHGCRFVMHAVDALRLKRNWDAFVQIVSRVAQVLPS